MKKNSLAIDNWDGEPDENSQLGVWNFKVFCSLKEVKDMDLVDQKALWETLKCNYFKYLLSKESSGRVDLSGIGTIRLIYRFFIDSKSDKRELKTKTILSESSTSRQLPIIECIDPDEFEKEMLK